MNTTANKLKSLREAKGMSQADCAKALGIDRTTYAKYENGGSVKRNVEKLASFFSVSTDYLLGRPEHEPITGNDTPAQAQAAAPKKPRKLLELIQDEEYTLNGQVATPEDREKIARVIEALYYDAKEKNKRK